MIKLKKLSSSKLIADMSAKEYIAISNNEAVSDKLTENYVVNKESSIDLLINDKN
jgi:hypothetical protein